MRSELRPLMISNGDARRRVLVSMLHDYHAGTLGMAADNDEMHYGLLYPDLSPKIDIAKAVAGMR